MDTVKRRIIVNEAASTKDSIRLYLNENPTLYYEGKIDDENEVTIELKKELDSDDDKEKNSMKLKIFDFIQKILEFGFRIVIMFFVLAQIIMHYAVDEYIAIFISDKYTTIFISLLALSGGISLFIANAFECLIGIRKVYKDVTNSTKSKHSAEHKIANLLEKFQRLPVSLDELQEISRFHKDCGDQERKKKIRSYAKGFSNAVCYIFLSFIILFVEKNISYLPIQSILYIVASIILLVLRDILVKYLTKIISKLFQMASTLRKPDERDLLLAWKVAEKWFEFEYPEYSEN